MNTQIFSPEVRVLIAIQARSTSSRFPGKIFEMIGRKTVLQHVIDAAKSSKFHIERSSKKVIIRCDIAVVHPENDKEVILACKQSGAQLIAGSEHNVLSRFVMAHEMMSPDYIVRLTSDCPLLLDYIISKHIFTAINNQLDYVSNVQEDCRQIADGFDVEIMSSKAIEWLVKNATDEYDQEHVTTALRKQKPNNLRFGFISSKLDTSHMKMSLDTFEDLERIRTYYHNREFKMETAKSIFGVGGIFEL